MDWPTPNETLHGANGDLPGDCIWSCRFKVKVNIENPFGSKRALVMHFLSLLTKFWIQAGDQLFGWHLG